MRNDSLRYSLLRRLLWPLIPVLLVGTALSYVLAKHAAVNTYDLGVMDDAQDLAEQVQWSHNIPQLQLPHVAAQMLSKNNEDRVIYAVWNSQGKIIDGDSALQAAVKLPASTSFKFQDLLLDQKKYRAIVLRSTQMPATIHSSADDGRTVYIAVAQTTISRNKLLNEIFFSMLLLGGGSVVVSSSVVLLGIRRGLMPVEALRDEIASRSPNDLRELSEADTPIELRPIVHGINILLRKLAAAFAAHRRFIADAAHQLRTPLATLGTQIEVCLEQPPENIKITLQQLLTTTRRTSHLANQLLSLARLEHTEKAVTLSELVDLSDVVQSAAADFIIPAEHKRIELEFDLEHCKVRGNALLLRELVANLLDNAVRYVPEQGFVNVTVRITEYGAELVVSDNGTGVTSTELPNLGKPFYRATSISADGCGLGLAIAGEIARLHEAKISFQNKLVGTGFYVQVKFTGQ